MSSSTLVRPAPAATGGDAVPAGCSRLRLDLADPGLEALTKVMTTLRGRRWDVRAVDADLDAGTVHVTVRTARCDLLERLLGRVVAVRAVEVL